MLQPSENPVSGWSLYHFRWISMFSLTKPTSNWAHTLENKW